ncbi:MAG: hypothetical protein M0Z48_01680 [Nitrospiraceae bacterium]|nr:hypothetical protein [Nitrospiraceae bacterium]
MHTLFDFITRTDAAEYGLMLFFILGFIVFLQVMKPRPFRQVVEMAASDVRFLKSQSRGRLLRLARNTAFAPVYFMFYLVSLPFLFVQGMATPLATAEWSPVRAYFTGRKARSKKSADEDAGNRP